MRNKNSVLKVWCISYILIFSIPFTVVFLNYFHNSKVLKQEIYYSHGLVLENLTRQIDTHLDKEREFSEQILGAPELITLMRQDERNSRFYLAAKNLYEKKQDLENTYEYISCIVSFPSTDYVIGSRADVSNVYYKGNTGIQEQVGYEQWRDLMFGTWKNGFVVEKYITGNAVADMTQEYMVHIKSMKWGGSRTVNVFTSIPITILEESTNFMKDGSIFIINIGGQPSLIFSSEGITELPEDVEYMNSTESMYEKGDNMIIRRQSLLQGVEYYMLIPKSDYLQELRNSRNLFVVSLVGTLLVGIFCMRFLLKYNYKPVSALCDIILKDDEMGNEFQNLENAYNRLLDEKSKINQLASDTQNVMMDFYLLSLMKNWPVSKQIIEKVQIHTFPKNVILIAFYFPMSEDKKDGIDYLFSFIVENVFSEYMAGEKFHVLAEGQYLYYVFYMEDKNDWKERCIKKLNDLVDFLTKKEKKQLLVAVSGWETEIEGIRKQYLAVREALESRSLLGENSVYDTDKITDDEDVFAKVVHYVEQHYTDVNLNVNTVVNELGYKAKKQVSKIFKNKTGISILDYIHALRIRKAQELIRENDYPLEEIYTTVGYTNDTTFRRAFLKITGMLPSDYKEKV